MEGKHATYKQYKHDTESIAGWLAKHAIACGYQISTPASTVAQSSTKRLKGKARKQARENPTAASIQESPDARYTIAISEFCRMAQAIADHKPKVPIPQALDNIFSRAIEARRKVTQWYEDHAEDDLKSNQRHSHFTNVLTAAWEILRPFKRPRASQTSKPQTAPSKSDEPLLNMTNRFYELAVEDPSDSVPEGEPGDSAQQNEDGYRLSDVEPVAIVQSEEDVEDEFFCAIILFMEELTHMRSHVISLWQAYAAESAELIVSALVTNTAIQLARRAEHELDLLIERPKKYPASTYPVWTLPAVLVYETHRESMKGFNLYGFIRPSPAVAFFDCVHADRCMSTIYTTLNHSLYEAKHLGRKAIAPVHIREDAPEYYNRIKEILPCLQHISMSMGDSFANDEITSGIGHIFKTWTIPIWTVFATQLLLDIQDSTHEVPHRAIHEVKLSAGLVLWSFKNQDHDQEPYTADRRRMTWLSSVMSAYELDISGDNFRKTAMAASAMKDSRGNSRKFKEEYLSNAPGVPEHLLKPDYFLHCNPLKCGLLKYGIYLQRHNASVQLEYTWRGICQMVHLYTATRSVYPNDPVWPDMEFFLQYQDLPHLFVGGRPRSMDEAFKKFMLSAGVTASSFAPDRRGPPKVNPQESRPLWNPCLLDGVFATWMSGGKVMTDDMITNLVNILTDPKVIPRLAKCNLETPIETAFRVPLGCRSENIGILKRMAIVAMSEIPSLYFDWFSFAETCQRIWEELAVALPKRGGEQAPWEKTGMTAHVLDEARKLQWIAEELNTDVDAFIRQNASGLALARGIIQKTIQKELGIPTIIKGKATELLKRWGGDNELFYVTSKLLKESHLLLFTPAMGTKAYQNWEAEKAMHSMAIIYALEESNLHQLFF
ncbi:hypothetical protein F4778DRAFT_13067 [Xylariomycetidae sp. FL2044]|nr:hypothetical protein F4778DRAFT_13067 [Xylariomycetidae sp. FL2044]